MNIEEIKQRLEANVSVFATDGIYGSKTWQDEMIEKINTDIQKIKNGADKGRFFKTQKGVYKVALSYWYTPLKVGNSNVAMGNRDFAIETLELYAEGVQAGIFDEQVSAIETKKNEERAKTVLNKAA